jgi:RimJ/RimL family protein N-acetyltransferase
VHTRRLVLRCWQPADAPLLVAAITESLEHLRAWMPWAMNEPEPVEKKIERLRGYRAAFDRDEDFVYGIFDRAEARVLGGTGLHTRAGPGAREIGYWIHRDAVGQGLATEASAALTQVAIRVDAVQRVEIHCDPANTRSAAVPRKLGFRHEATLRERTTTPAGEPRDTMIWTLLASELAGSPAAEAPVEAFDAAGRRLL